MNDKSLQRALDNITFDVNAIFILLSQKIEELEQDLVELEKQHEESLKVAYKNGYDDAVLMFRNL